MNQREVMTAVEAFLDQHSYTLANDFAACADQKTGTSRHLRREKALSYMIETESQGMYLKFSEQYCLDLIALIAVLKANAKSAEARTGYERAEHRLGWLLSHPEQLRGKNECIGCGEIIDHNQPHECTNAVARGKNSQLARDPDLEVPS